MNLSEWRFFIRESKAWMSYQECSWRGKLSFWLFFPRAAYRFWKLSRSETAYRKYRAALDKIHEEHPELFPDR